MKTISKITRVVSFVAISLFGFGYSIHAQEEKDYPPQIKGLLSLVEPTTIDKEKPKNEAAGFKESPELHQYFEQDLYHNENSEDYCKFFRGKAGGQDAVMEYQYLPDGRIYRANFYVNVGSGSSYDDETIMMTMKIIYNNMSKKIVELLGLPTVYYQEMKAPFKEEDYEDGEGFILALRSNNLKQSARWISKKYAGTMWEKTPTIELSMHTLKMIKISVTDIDILKLSGQEPEY